MNLNIVIVKKSIIVFYFLNITISELSRPIQKENSGIKIREKKYSYLFGELKPLAFPLGVVVVDGAVRIKLGDSCKYNIKY